MLRPWVLLSALVLVSGCDALREPETPEATTAENTQATTPQTHHDQDARCFPRTMGLLDQSARALGNHDAVRGQALAFDAQESLAVELRASSCLGEVGERVRARQIALRQSALRNAGADDVEVLLDLGREHFDTSDCKEELVPLCEEELAWYAARFPSFVDGTTVAIESFDRFPTTPQPGGRLTVEYMRTVDNRLPGLRGDWFAITIHPSARIDGAASVELRVDGADVYEESDDCFRGSADAEHGASSGAATISVCPKEKKTGAHVSLQVPKADLLRANDGGPMVVIVQRSGFSHSGTTWRGNARVAYSTH